jgi:hypothetical protein
MNLNRSTVLAIMAVAASFAVTVVQAGPNTVILDTTSTYYPGLGGGEFTATTSEDFTGNYAADAKVPGGFQTFCMETGVEFSPGASYYYTLGNITQPNPANDQAGSGLQLSKGTAYLYYQFGKGLLSDFNYTPGAGRMADDNLLQAAIWALQGGQSYGSYPVPTTLNNKFYADAISILGGSVLDPYTDGIVAVLQVWANADDTGPAQNQLVLLGVPDGGLTVALLGGALIGLQVMRRKLLC